MLIAFHAADREKLKSFHFQTKMFEQPKRGS